MEPEKNRVKETKSENRKENLSSITTSFTTNFKPYLPANGWSVLAIFATQKRSFSVNELKNIFKQSMHINTIRAMIERLKEKALIKLYLRNTGRTHSENRFIITMDGLSVWDIYTNR